MTTALLALGILAVAVVAVVLADRWLDGLYPPDDRDDDSADSP